MNKNVIVLKNPQIKEITDLTREELLDYITDIAKNWAAIDGLWFQAVERAYGLEAAMQMDEEVWCRYPVIEANRIKKRLSLPENGGIPALIQAFRFRPYASVNKQKVFQIAENKVVFQMNECRQQEGRRRAGLPPHPCKSPGYCEYSSFASTIDSRFKTTCLCCPPDETPPGIWCAWEFELIDEEQ
ncbi:MAG: DUF6125 family protein [Bacillota bacterium]